MATAGEASSAIEAGYEKYIAELGGCEKVWETKPAGSADGEAAWCAREVAEHIAGSGPFFGAGIAAALGVTGPTPSRVTLASCAEALTATKQSQGVLMDVVRQIKDDQMAMEIDHPRLGKQTLGGILGILSYHYNDHATQLKTLRGG